MSQIFYSIEEILSEIFFDNISESINLLKEYGFYTLVNEHLIFLKEKKDNEIKEAIETVVISFIQTVNTKLYDIDDEDNKLELKYLLSEIGNYIIDCINLERPKLKSLKSALISLSELKGYDYKDIESRLQISRLIRISTSTKDDLIEELDKRPYYEWLSKDYKIDEISKNLKSENIIKSVKSFKRIFTTEPEEFQTNPDKREFLFILFDVLYDNNFIKPKIKKGKFLPLQKYCVDFQNKILFKKKPKYIKQEIKKKAEKYERLKAKAKKWL
ncbi:hypothetical protein [Tenacibaculum maritimum]|uniref:hypothetical protein n=1 Tax=Tenacibaculum maritimum TaxID=107401 RepID=UPI0012E6E5FA|nr:hypothetical protein [Tenacibaculum maritimum]MCD9563705.1 hypothetical protein [Tenacibaculum maritimum]MCD9565892.1 hypothetical protein [Tenacibaculum maritimum]MCD9579440.1 hypothetical protein [Tenacibaculum maritimum]MCD9596199.1 hypothetical protein [Tenacibaculum maritimum]MCD9613448.1 hypothetical protein [Tenacibaculum maritimum]